MSQKITYKVGVNGQIDDSKVYVSEHEAVAECYRLSELYERVSVYGESVYSDDDRTPIHARTTFWCAYRLHNYGLRKDFGGDFDNV